MDARLRAVVLRGDRREGTRAMASSPVWATAMRSDGSGPVASGSTRISSRRDCAVGPASMSLPSHSTRATTTCQCGAAPRPGSSTGAATRRRAAISAGAAPVWTSSRTSCARRRRTVRAASLRSRSTAISWVTPWSRSSRSSGQSLASASTASSQSDRTVSRTSRAACAAERPLLRIGKREYSVVPRVIRCGPRRPCGRPKDAPPPASRTRRRAAPDPGLRARDEPSRRRQHPGLQVQVGTEEVEDHVRAAARGARGHHPAVPVDHGREIPGPLAADLPYDMLGDRRERHRLVHREERQAVPGAGQHQIVGDVAELGLTGPQRRHTGLGQDADERLGVRGVAAPRQSREHQLAAGEIAAGIPEVGGHHAAHGAVQLVLAAEQLEAQRVGVQQCAQPHSRRRRSLSRNLRWILMVCGWGPVDGPLSGAGGGARRLSDGVPGHKPVPGVSREKRGGYW